MKKKYSIPHLLSKQSKQFKKHKDFGLLISFFNSSEVLKKLYLGKKSYSLLNNAKISSGKLDIFYKYFKIPRNPFFPLFLKIKGEYIQNKNYLKNERNQNILNKMQELPEDISVYLKYFAKYEKSLNNKKQLPLWNKILYPKTIKAAENFLKYNRSEWTKLFYKYVDELKNHYKPIDGKYAEKILGLFILKLPIKKHPVEIIKTQYRLLSKIYHPDAGGSSYDFNSLQKAKNLFI